MSLVLAVVDEWVESALNACDVFGRVKRLNTSVIVKASLEQAARAVDNRARDLSAPAVRTSPSLPITQAGTGAPPSCASSFGKCRHLCKTTTFTKWHNRTFNPTVMVVVGLRWLCKDTKRHGTLLLTVQFMLQAIASIHGISMLDHHVKWRHTVLVHT